MVPALTIRGQTASNAPLRTSETPGAGFPAQLIVGRRPSQSAGTSFMQRRAGRSARLTWTWWRCPRDAHQATWTEIAGAV